MVPQYPTSSNYPPMAGQILFLTSNQNGIPSNPVPYFVHNYVNTTPALPPPPPAPPQHQEPLAIPQQQQRVSQLKERNFKEKFFHYINGQTIIETSEHEDIKHISKKIRIQKTTKIKRPIVQTSETKLPIVHTNEIERIRDQMSHWSVSEVVKFIEDHNDIKQYAHKFADDEVDGKALLLMIDRNLNIQMLSSMFKHGPAMKIEAALSKYKQAEQK